MFCLLENVNPVLVFETRSGDLSVARQGEGYVMDFPLNQPTKKVQHVHKNYRKSNYLFEELIPTELEINGIVSKVQFTLTVFIAQ